MFHVFLLWDQWLLRAFLKADGRSGREKSGKRDYLNSLAQN